MCPPVRPLARRLPRPPVRFGSAVLASLAVALAGAAPGASAAPLHVPTERPIQSVQPPPAQQVVRDVPFHVPSTLASGPLAHDVTNALNVGNVTAPHLSDTTAPIAPIDQLPTPGSAPPPSPPPPTPVITPQTTLLMEAPFEDLQAAWQQATDLTYVVNDAQGTPAVLGVNQSQVPSASVNIEVPVGLLDATLSPIFPQPVAPDSQAFAPVLGGDHGIATVQVDDCLPDGQGQAAGLSQFLDPASGQPVGCTDPVGNVGSRYILGGGQTNLYTTTSPAGQQIVRTFGQDCGDAQAPSPGGLAQSCVLIPVHLPAIANALRLDIDLHVIQDQGDTNTECVPGNFCPVSGKRPEMAPAGELALLDTSGSRAETTGSVALEPIVVLPAALTQLKVLPYTIVYMPPGNASTSSFTTTTAFGTTMTAGDSTALDNTTKSSKSLDIATTVSASFASGGLSLGANLSTDSHWDHTTSADVGSVQTDATTDTSQMVKVRDFGPLSNGTLVPGAKGAFGSEPFWSDEIVLLQHPQLGVWDLNGATKVQLLGARGTVEDPDFAEPSLKDLDDCGRSAAPYVSGYPLPDGDVLNASECLALALLDPFYSGGQSFDPSAIGRGAPAGGTDYGMDPAGTGQDEHQGFDQVISWQQTNSTTRSTSYDASVTDVFGTNYSAGLTLGAKGAGDADVGFKTSVTLTAGSSTSSSVAMKISYQNSTATHVQKATTIDGSFDDHNASLGYRPHVYVFQDVVFGSYMFQDQKAPGGCPRFDCGPGAIPLVNPGANNPPPRIVIDPHPATNPALSETGTTRLGTTTTTAPLAPAPIRRPGLPPVVQR